MNIGKHSKQLTQLAVNCSDKETRYALVKLSMAILREGGIIPSMDPILRTQKQSGNVVEKGVIVGKFEQNLKLIDHKIETTITIKGNEPVTSYEDTEFLGLMG